MTGPRIDPMHGAHGVDAQGVAQVPRILSPDEFQQARGLSPAQLGQAKFPVLPPVFAPRDAVKTSDPNAVADKGTPLTGLPRILTQYVAAPIMDHPLTTAATALIPGAGTVMAGLMGKDIAEYVAQKAAEQSLPPDVKAMAEADPTRISGERAAVEAAMLGAAPLVHAALKGKSLLPDAIKAHSEAVADSFNQIFDPASRSPEAGVAANILRSTTGHAAGAYEQAAFRLDQFRRSIEPLSDADKLGFIDAIEGGRSQATPEFQKAADTMREILDGARQDVQDLGTGKLEHFIDDYFPHIWNDPVRARDAFKTAQAEGLEKGGPFPLPSFNGETPGTALTDAKIATGGKRPMEGGKSFLKQRTIPTTAEGMALGLTPVSMNPVDLTLLKLREMQRYVMAHQSLNEMKDAGLVQFVRAGEAPPDGYARIDDKIATVFGPREGVVTLPEGEAVIQSDAGKSHPIKFSLSKKEQIVTAASRSSDGRLFVAPTHGEAINFAEHDPSIRFGGDEAHGFLTSKGRFVSRDEALRIADDFGPLGQPGVDLGEAEDAGHLDAMHVHASVRHVGELVTTKATPNVAENEIGIPGMRIIGQYHAPAEVATVVNNYLSPGLRGNAIYDAYRGLGNTLNQAQLGLSAFHLGFTSMDASVSRAALGLEYLASGKPLQGLAEIASAPVAPITNMRLGAKIRSAYLDPANASPEMQSLANAVKEAGGRVRQDSFYENSAPQKMLDAWKNFAQGPLGPGGIRDATQRGSLAEGGKAAGLLVPSLLEAAAKPIMEHVVPMQKLGVFGDMAKKVLADLPPDATLADRRDALAKAWDSVDNRMGQVVYDNLFWNKTFKDLAMGSVRSVGWNLGTIRELGGGLGDLAANLPKIASADGGAELTHRAAYVAALPLTVGLYGALYQYLRTGEGPSEFKDYYYPKTGEVDADGNPERVQLPSYMKDVFAYGDHPWETVKHKISPILATTYEMLNNEDYFGDQIRNQDDPFMQRMAQDVEHLGKAFVPFGIRNLGEQSKRGDQSTITKTGNFVGITPAPRKEVRSDAQNMMADIQAQHRTSGATPEMADARKTRSEILNGMRGNSSVDLQTAVNDAIERHQLTPRNVIDLLRRAGSTPAQEKFKGLTLDQAIAVFKISTPDEQRKFGELLVKKVENAK